MIIIIILCAWFLLLCWIVIHGMDKHMATLSLPPSSCDCGFLYPARSYFTLEEIHAAQEMVRQSEIEKRNGDAIETR